MRRISTAAIAAILLAACAAAPDEQLPDTRDQNQAVEDFIEVRSLEEADRMRGTERGSWQEITTTYIIYKAQRGDYLVKFTRPCYELRDYERIIADTRYEPNVMRARFDTLRGCRIGNIYPLTEAEVVELEQLGEAVGSRN